MKIFIITLLLLSNEAFALQVTDPDTICETKTATLAVSSFKHCNKGDLVKVDAYEMQRVCELNATIVPIQSEYLCVYRGSKRNSRNRPLSEAEKAVDKEQDNNLVEKYSK